MTPGDLPWPTFSSAMPCRIDLSRKDCRRGLRRKAGRTWWITNQLGENKAREPILAELGKSRVVVVLWSKASIASPFVVHQAIAARDATQATRRDRSWFSA